eukprot:COSAG02_NODE_1472_length_12451_cov_183.797037_3_plen_1172_part_00
MTRAGLLCVCVCVCVCVCARARAQRERGRMAPGGMRIMSWKSPKEGPVSSASDILAFQPTAMAASRRQREERTEARRAAYRAKIARREASRGMPKRPNIGPNPLEQKAEERAVALRQGEALARSISQGRLKNAAPRQRSWEAAQPEDQPGRQEQLEAIKDRNEKIKQELLLAAQQWERKPRALGPKPRAFSKPRPRLWQRPSSAPIPPPADLDDGGIRHDFGSDVDPEDLPDLDAAEPEEPDASTVSNGVEDRGPITSQLVRQPSVEMFLQTAKVESDVQKALANLQLELESPAKARQPKGAAVKSKSQERPRSASYHEASSGSKNERTRRSPSTLEYLKTISNENAGSGVRGVETTWNSTLEELSDTALATDVSSFPDELSRINNVITTEGLGRGTLTPNASTADELGPMALDTSLGIEDLQVGSGGLATLRIREYGMRDAMCINVAASIKSDRSTGKAPLLVDLAHNLISDEGVLALADAIETNSRCAALDLSYNFVKSDGAVALARCLPHSKLRRLDLSHNTLGSKGTKSIGNAIGLPGAAGLRSLKISHVGMGAVGTVALAEGVAANKGLRLLDISGNQLRNSGAMALAANLELNVTRGDGAGLTALDLSWCGIDDPPVQLLAQGLKTGCSLRRLDLSNNQVSTDGAQHLAMMMKGHKGLQLLILDNNPAIAFEGCKKFVSLQLDNVIDEVVFEEDNGGEGTVKMAGTAGKRIVHVVQCSAEQLPSKMLGASNQWERHLYKVGICGLSMSGFGLPAAGARASSAQAAFEAAKRAQAAAAAGENVVTQADAEDAVEKAAAALAKEEEEAKLAEEAASKERQEADEAKRRSQQEWADVVQAERWLAKAEAALDAALMLPDGDAEVEAAEKEMEKARAILEKEKAEAEAAEDAFRREREEADIAEAKAAKEREEAEEARRMLKTKEARARTGAGATVKKEVKKAAVPKQVRRRPRTAKFVMKRAVGKQIVQQRLRVETMTDTVKSLGIPLKGGGTSRRNPPICGAASADPLDRRRTTGSGSKIHALHYTDTSLRTDHHLSQSSAMLQRPKDQSMMASYSKGFTNSRSRISLIRPQSAAGNYTAGMSALPSTRSPSASNLVDPNVEGLENDTGRQTSGRATDFISGSQTAFGSSSSVRHGASARRPHTAGVGRPIRSVDSYIPVGSYTAVA